MGNSGPKVARAAGRNEQQSHGMVSSSLGTEGPTSPGVQLPNAKANQRGRAKKGKDGQAPSKLIVCPTAASKPHGLTSSYLLGMAKLEGGHHGSPGVRGESASFPGEMWILGTLSTCPRGHSLSMVPRASPPC